MATLISSKKATRPKTLNRGAADARALVKDAILAEMEKWKNSSHFVGIASFAANLRKRVDAQAKNAGKRKGGLGRK